MKQFTITAAESGQRFEKYIKRVLPAAGTGFVYRMLRKKNITLNGKRADGSERLATGDVVAFYFSDETFAKFAEAVRREDDPGRTGSDLEQRCRECREAFHQLEARFGPMQIAYEDRNVLLPVKPAGVLSQKAAPSDVSLNEWFVGRLLETGERQAADLSWYMPSVANRLDRNTGGLVLCTKTLPASRFVSQLLRDRTLHKYYRLVVTGDMTCGAPGSVFDHAGAYDHSIGEDQTISAEISVHDGPGVYSLEGYLSKDPTENRVRVELVPFEGASFVRTVWRPLQISADGRLTLLEAELITGRTHQLRAQFAAEGHPILGDPKYGDPVLNRAWRARGVTHQLLFCTRVEFPSVPQTKENKETGLTALSGRVVSADVPDIFYRVMDGK